ncbi:MAG: AIR synthase-related protein [Solirubrobacteraceae bacterium]
MTPRDGPSEYRSTGVDYAALDAGKRDALTAAMATSQLLSRRPGGRAIDESRGEPAFVFEFAGQMLALVLEGLGTKSIIARQVQEELGENHFDAVAYDAVAAIVNDLCCVGALPLVINAYFATGLSDWYRDADRQAALLDGWQRACSDAGATWGGGESPSLPGLVDEREIELAGSAIGAIAPGQAPILGARLTAGDEIVFVASSGLHANGASLARLLVKDLPDRYATVLEADDRRRTFGQALLEPTVLYARLVEALLQNELPIHYLSHITGHGLLKLMRPDRDFSYRITELPQVPAVLRFMVERAGLSPAAAYSTFNMGCGYAIYCAAGTSAKVIEIAEGLSHEAHLAGVVDEGPRRVLIPSLDIVYETDAMDLTPRRAA